MRLSMPQSLLFQAPATWSPTNKDVGITLSNGNKTATALNNGDATVQNGLASAAVMPGQRVFWSLRFTGIGTFNQNYVGIATDQFPLSGVFISDVHSGGLKYNSPFWNNPGVSIAGAPVLNTVMDFALDAGARLVWVRLDGGVWNNGGGADPATGVLGIDISGLIGSTSPPPLYPAYCLTGDAGGVGTVVANFGSTAYPFAAPAGYANLG